jgi:hypothetical protein
MSYVNVRKPNTARAGQEAERNEQERRRQYRTLQPARDQRKGEKQPAYYGDGDEVYGTLPFFLDYSKLLTA